MKIKEIAFSSYAVTDVKRARNFYENILGLKASSVFEQDGMAFIEYEIGPHTISIGAGAPNFKPGPNGGIVAFEVDDFDGFAKKMKDSDVPVVMDAMDTGPCHMMLVKDPDGNYLMIHQRKKTQR